MRVQQNHQTRHPVLHAIVLAILGGYALSVLGANTLREFNDMFHLTPRAWQSAHKAR